MIYAVPGVPYEMKEMLERAIIPDLQARSGETAAIVSRTLRTWGESESRLAELLAPRIDALDASGQPDDRVPRQRHRGHQGAHHREGADEASALALLADEEAEVRAILGDARVRRRRRDDGAAPSARCCGRRAGRSALAESLTGGLVASRVTDVPGASDWSSRLGRVLRDRGEVRRARRPAGPGRRGGGAMAMADGARRVLGSDVGLSVTGVAGPAEQDGQPVGTVFFGLALSTARSKRSQLRLPGDRDQMRQFATISLMDLLRLRLLDRVEIG